MKKHSAGPRVGTMAGGAIALLLLLYLFVPLVYALPMYHLVVQEYLPPWVMKFFAPLEFLEKKVPGYRALIRKEEEICESMGLVPR